MRGVPAKTTLRTLFSRTLRGRRCAKHSSSLRRPPSWTSCAPGANEELKGLVDGVAPAKNDILECNWGTSWGSDRARTDGCFYFAPGRLKSVGEAVLARMASQGFTVTCRVDAHAIELTGSRDGTMFYADILANGFIHGRNVEAAEVDIPRGHVFVDIAAVEDDAGLQPEGSARTRRAVLWSGDR